MGRKLPVQFRQAFQEVIPRVRPVLTVWNGTTTFAEKENSLEPLFGRVLCSCQPNGPQPDFVHHRQFQTYQ